MAPGWRWPAGKAETTVYFMTAVRPLRGAIDRTSAREGGLEISLLFAEIEMLVEPMVAEAFILNTLLMARCYGQPLQEQKAGRGSRRKSSYNLVPLEADRI